ncbi:hypothetical protein D3C81_1342380 [compost metagenome]
MALKAGSKAPTAVTRSLARPCASSTSKTRRSSRCALPASSSAPWPACCWRRAPSRRYWRWPRMAAPWYRCSVAWAGSMSWPGKSRPAWVWRRRLPPAASCALVPACSTRPAAMPWRTWNWASASFPTCWPVKACASTAPRPGWNRRSCHRASRRSWRFMSVVMPVKPRPMSW